LNKKKNKKAIPITRVCIVTTLALLLILPGIYASSYSLKKEGYNDQKTITKIARQIEIPADSDYYIKFNSENLVLEGQEIEPYAQGLYEKVKYSIAKSPLWIQGALTRQFHAINNSEEYADLLLNVSKKYIDEIAFSIAYSSEGNVPPVNILRDNVFSLYENDKWIRYADIIDYDNGQGDYYSTIRYKVIENGIEKQFEYPKDIYYWYVVQPETCSEDAEYIYGKFWRDYLFNHNDLGYPLLKEKISNIEYLWDCESYHQPEHRLWSWSVENHPTAIEAIGYWIGKTVPIKAIGDRPGQPNVIAHEHNGNCGEMQRIAVAVQRTLLVPSVGVCHHGGDHVWREFFERDWHENDNWWSDGGGAVDDPDIYRYGGGENGSLYPIFAWRGDDSIYEVTARYIHPEDQNTITFVVKDSYLHPVDGVRVIVVVYTPHYSTYLKNLIWETIEEIWDRFPQFIKGKIIQSIYERVKEWYWEKDGLLTATWNYTDTNGECTFELDKEYDYFFVIQQGNKNKKPWQLTRNNAVRILRGSRNTPFNIFFLDFSHRIQKHYDHEMPEGECFFNISFDTNSYQLHMSPIWIDDIGTYDTEGKIDFFVLDEENFGKYKKGRKFDCFNYLEDSNASIGFSAGKNDWYMVFRNHAYRTNTVVDFSIQVEASTNTDKVQIVSHDTSIFDNPIFNVGDTVNISGFATDDVVLNIDGELISLSPVDWNWFYLWNTYGLMPGEYAITVECNSVRDDILITLIDAAPPEIEIEYPLDGEIIEGESIVISGRSWDNLGVERVEVALDNSRFRKATGAENWFIEWNISGFDLGEHIISVKAFDVIGRESVHRISFVVNETGHDWRPLINSFYHMPEDPTNISNIVVYADVTSENPFDVKKVLLYVDDGTEIESYRMYRYGDNPKQERHEEDPLRHKPNNPIFGFELGQITSIETITYWIIAYDTANNSKYSCEKSFTIE